MKVLIALLWSIAWSAQAETFSAKVIVVMDGDTVMVLRDGQKIKIRMANIDAPEVGHAGMGDTSPNSQKDQEFGLQSRNSLLSMLDKKQVQIDSQAVDQYGRIVGVISLAGLNINAEQVRRGMAWEYSHFHSDRSYIALQNEAQQAQRGLWASSNPQAPWLWRKSHPSVKPDTPQVSGKSVTGSAAKSVFYDASCGHKKHCTQMSSCEEANFYFKRCGVVSLDRDKDGIPCENLCTGK